MKKYMVSIEDTFKRVIDLAMNKPDQRAVCRYVEYTYDDEGETVWTPCCIVGHAMFDLDFDPTVMAEHNTDNIFARQMWFKFARMSNHDNNRRLINFLHWVQKWQDSGYTWADSVCIAIDNYHTSYPNNMDQISYATERFPQWNDPEHMLRVMNAATAEAAKEWKQEQV